MGDGYALHVSVILSTIGEGGLLPELLPGGGGGGGVKRIGGCVGVWSGRG